ncbi:hypothetical protein BGZ76_004529, partial [Entomortierella beljakovae]
MEHDRFMQIVRQEGRLSRDDFVTYDNVYNIWYKITCAKMRKDNDPVLSSIIWMKELAKDQAFTFYEQGDKPDGVYFGFSTKWQLEQLKENGRTVCFDGTHSVFGQKTQLFTLVVKNVATGFGIPVSFLLTKSADNRILSSWLKALRMKMQGRYSTPESVYVFTPNAVITDQGNTEILAISTAFAGESVPIFYCAWHVLRVWKREIKKRMTGLGALRPDKRVLERSKVLCDLRSIPYQLVESKAFELITTFLERNKDQTELCTYLENYYFFGRKDNEGKVIPLVMRSTRKYWMVCFRQNVLYSSIDTNNYIESWYNILKRHFFKDNQQRRPDTVIYILAFMAIPHFQKK